MTPSISFDEQYLSDDIPVTAPRRQIWPCATCKQLLRGPLAPCIYPACQAADARATAAEERRYES